MPRNGNAEAAVDEAVKNPAEAGDAETKPKPSKENEDRPAGKKAPMEVDEAEKPADEAEKKEEEAAPANPIGQIFQNIFGRAKRPARPAAVPVNPNNPQQKGPANGDATARDPIDARAPHDSTQARRLKAAQRAIAEKNWRGAIDSLQAILDQPQDSLVRDSRGKWSSIRLEANRLLEGLPKEAIDLYELQYGAQARQLIHPPPGTLENLVEAATRYFFTQAGQQAADRLAARAFANGEFAIAASWNRQLMAANSSLAQSPAWKLRAAAALHHAGDEKAAAALRDSLAGGMNAELSIGGRSTSANDWWKANARAKTESTPALDEWSMFLGTSGRIGATTGGAPLLLPRWSLPLTSSTPVKDQIASLMDDLSDARRALVPALFPIMVDGKVIFRTLRGFAVVEAATGKVLWETREGVSAEKLLNGIGPSSGMEEAVNFNGNFRFNRQFFMQNYGGNGMGDQHPLTSLLFRDANFGMPVSDGRRLYIVEDLAILSRQEQGYGWWNGGFPMQNDAYVRDWASNKITAYDLQTGRPLWDTGGQEMLEPFDLPLAGTFFFGAPLPDGDELFAIGEKSNDIRLHAIDALTGQSRWSQLLAVSDAKIEQDIVRRRWVAPVSAGNGILVCPTTVGWLVAVDRTRRSILWAQRFSKPQPDQRQQFNGGIPMTPAGELNMNWSASAPMIGSNRVVYAPPEEQSLYCLRLSDGAVQWEKPKEEGVYVAGLFGDRVVVVGKQSVSGLSLANGQPLWTVNLSETEGRPSGFGVAVGDLYHLPLATGQLWSIALSSGEVKFRSFLSSGSPALGNLGMYQGLLLSLSTEGLTAFEQRAAVEQEIAARKQANPKDAWALQREADIALLSRDYPKVLERLRALPQDQLAAADRPRFRKAMVESLAALIQKDFTKYDDEAAELAAFVETESEKLLQQRLLAERMHARKDYEAAFKTYLSLTERPLDQLVSQSDAPVRVRLDRWLAGRLLDLWTEAPDPQRAAISAEIESRAKAALAGTRKDRTLFSQLFAFHPQSFTVRQKLAEELIAADDLIAAEVVLNELSRVGVPEVEADATLRLARLWAAKGCPADAEFHYRFLERRWPQTALSEGGTVAELIARLKTAGLLSAEKANGPGWAAYDLQLQRSVPNYMQQDDQELPEGLSRLPWFAEHRLRVYQNTQRLAVLKAANDEQEWIVPLRMNARNSQSQWTAAQAAGHALYVLHRDVLHCLSPVERKVLWTRPIDNRGAASGYYRHPGRWMPQAMRPSPVGMWSEEQNLNGMMPVANDQYVCLYGRREFTVLDPATGQLLWSRTDVPPGTTVLGTSEALLVQFPDRLAVMRARDGKELASKELNALRSRMIAISGDHLIVMYPSGGRRLFGLAAPSQTMKAIHPVTGKELWSHDFPTGSVFSSLGGGQMAVLRGDGKVEQVDLATGVAQTLGEIDAADLKSRSETYAFHDADRIYIMVNQPRKPQQFYFGEELATLPANGTLVAFDRSQGGILWKEKVLNQTIVVSQLSNSPVLTFTGRTYIRKANFAYWHLKLLVLDKVTGRRLLESASPSSSGFRALDVNLSDRYIELRSYNERLRLVAVERTPSKESASAPAEAATP